ncbi:uncharacterized protein LOC123310947 [Coccinella septempunctata]|uniref:uncharacterized protein LOC123310947 n=1 Tax=Coccinella septempunctata TaxID=41139 RepID=UPI001D095B5A|nr:uncharacterized protein LOC123310947 [Coccinella septempunctata]
MLYKIMVRNYKRKTNRGKWSEAQMKLAIQEVLDGKKGYKSASKAYNVPQTTLERKVNQARKRENGVQNVKVPLGPITTVFSEEEEQILVDYLKEMEGRLFGLSSSEFQKLAYELAVRNNKQHKFNALKEKAGKDWLRGFLNRHPDLSLRKPENTSAARAAGFNRVSVGKFFELLGKTLDDNRFTPDRIYNCDETGVSVVPKSRSKVMLILDGHATHTQNLQLIDEARKYDVTIICFPPHTTHKLQPADVGFMRPLSIFYDQALTAWLRSNPGKVVSQFQVAELFGQAFIRAATMLTAINAFKACGISLYNPHIFTEDNFIAAEATEIELNAEKEPEADTTPTLSIAATSQRTLTVLPTITSSPPDTQTATHTTINSSANTLPHPTATTSYVVQQASVNDSLDNAAFHLVSPKQLMPYPRMAEKKTRQVRRRGKAAIITASPYKTELEEKQNSRKPKPDVSSEKKMKKLNKRSRKTKKAEEEAQTSEEEDTACLYCHGLYSESTEGWITCQVCSNWAHCGCAGVEDNDDEAVHICPLCEDED